MDHLNYFHPYKGKKEGWEDTLTRAMLVLVKYIPAVQEMFIDLVRERQGRFDEVDRVPSMTAGPLSLDVESQRSTIRNNEGILISVFITDEEVEDLSSIKTASRENAVYDGIVYYGDSITIIIEDKPSAKNLWRDQLNPSRSSLRGKDIKPVGHPICLTWGRVIERLNFLMERSILSYMERMLINDFFQFIDSGEFSSLRPYKTLGVCGAHASLLDKRCRVILEDIGNVPYHPGWKHYLECEVASTCRMVALGADPQDAPKSIKMELHPGASVPQARNLFLNLDREKLRKCKEDGWEIVPNFHFMDSFRQFFWAQTELDLWEYLDFWKNYDEVERHFRRDSTNFKELVDQYRINGMLSSNDVEVLENDLINSGRNVLRVIPGLSIYYRWPLKDASDYDASGSFVKEVKRRIGQIFPCWGQSLSSIIPRQLSEA